MKVTLPNGLSIKIENNQYGGINAVTYHNGHTTHKILTVKK